MRTRARSGWSEDCILVTAIGHSSYNKINGCSWFWQRGPRPLDTGHTSPLPGRCELRGRSYFTNNHVEFGNNLAATDNIDMSEHWTPYSFVIVSDDVLSNHCFSLHTNDTICFLKAWSPSLGGSVWNVLARLHCINLAPRATAMNGGDLSASIESWWMMVLGSGSRKKVALVPRSTRLHPTFGHGWMGHKIR